MGDPKDMPPAKAMAGRERMESREGTRPAGSRDQVRSLHHGGASSGCVVAADFRYSRHRAALGARGRDASGNCSRTQDHASRGRVSGAGRSDSIAPGSDADLGGRAVLMEWADRQRLRSVSPRHRQTAAAGLADFLGRAYSRGGRRDSRQRRTGNLALSEGPGAQAPDLFDRLPGAARF